MKALALSQTQNRNIDKITSPYWTNLLNLLGLVLVVDQDECSGKIETFFDVATELKYVIDPTYRFSRKTIKSWLQQNWQILNDKSSHMDDDYLHSLLTKIMPRGHKLDILTSMVRIAIAEGNYSDAQQILTRKTILYWQ